jgi:hypothetical protein
MISLDVTSAIEISPQGYSSPQSAVWYQTGLTSSESEIWEREEWRRGHIPFRKAIAPTGGASEEPNRPGATVPEATAANVAEIVKPSGRTVEDITLAYRGYRLRELFRRSREHLASFEQSLGTPESAVWIGEFRSCVSDLWKYVNPEDTVLGRRLSAIQSAIRFQKWREFQKDQVLALREALEGMMDQRKKKDVKDTYRTFYRSGIDVFPSADDKEDELYMEGAEFEEDEE